MKGPSQDAHVHLFSRRFFELLTGDPAKACKTLGWECPPADTAQLAREWALELDKHGVGRAALIASIPGDEQSVIDAAAAAPGRFLRFALVNPKKQSAIPAELDAICLFPAMHGYSVAGGVADDAIRQARAVFVHCGVLSVGVRKRLGLSSPFDMRYSNPLDLHSVALRFSDKPFIVPHFGAGMFREALMLCDLCSNVRLDTSSSNRWMAYEGLDLKTVFRRALDVVGPGRILFGSDSSYFPRGWNAAVYESQKSALDALGVSESDQRDIFGRNLEQLFAG